MFAWGCGSCLGCGSSETTSLRPRFIEELSVTKIIDISCGDSHCLALSHGESAAAMTQSCYNFALPHCITVTLVCHKSVVLNSLEVRLGLLLYLLTRFEIIIKYTSAVYIYDLTVTLHSHFNSVSCCSV